MVLDIQTWIVMANKFNMLLQGFIAKFHFV